MLENFLIAETEKLNKTQQKAITGGDTAPEESDSRKGKVAAK